VDVVRQAIEEAMPHCKTQAHFDLVTQAWNALQTHLNAVYGFDKETAAKALQGLHQLLELAPKVAEAHRKLQDNPEATANLDYIEPAKELTEHHKHQTLLAELGGIDSRSRLQSWYISVKPILDGIVSQKLRDELCDAIRVKKQSLAN
jgi:hypothetical protein